MQHGGKNDRHRHGVYLLDDVSVAEQKADAHAQERVVDNYREHDEAVACAEPRREEEVVVYC